MKTPICDFINKYKKEKAVRLHMPGHKGKGFLGFEENDITEIDGADALFLANGIIKESENNASCLFEGGATLYSCEGSSLSVKAMCHLAKSYAISNGKSKGHYILATRNAHASFVGASILLDFDIKWLNSDNSCLLSGKVSAENIKNELICVDNLPIAVFITSPDYLGNICDIKEIALVCKEYNIPLLVDNAHGAYLKFLGDRAHPIDLGATLVCDSAHKTLPVLTGGGYLHISKDANEFFYENAKAALSIFASSSPSYLILSSLDGANKYLAGTYKDELVDIACRVDKIKERLLSQGYKLIGDEKLKITIAAKEYGYLGGELYSILKNNGIVCEFYDKDFIVMMFSPANNQDELDHLLKVLLEIPKKSAILDTPPLFSPCKKVMSPKDAYFSACEEVPVFEAVGRVMSSITISCPPAICVVSCGEEISKEAALLLNYYGHEKCRVVKK